MSRIALADRRRPPRLVSRLPRVDPASTRSRTTKAAESRLDHTLLGIGSGIDIEQVQVGADDDELMISMSAEALEVLPSYAVDGQGRLISG